MRIGQCTRQLPRLDGLREKLHQVRGGHGPDNVHFEPRPCFQKRHERLALTHVNRAIESAQIRDLEATGFDRHDRRQVLGRDTTLSNQGLPLFHAKLPRQRQLRALYRRSGDGRRNHLHDPVDLPIFHHHRQLRMYPLSRHGLEQLAHQDRRRRNGHRKCGLSRQQT